MKLHGSGGTKYDIFLMLLGAAASQAASSDLDRMSRMPWSWLSNGRSAKSQVEKRISADPKAFELTDIRPQMG